MYMYMHYLFPYVKGDYGLWYMRKYASVNLVHKHCTRKKI